MGVVRQRPVSPRPAGLRPIPTEYKKLILVPYRQRSTTHENDWGALGIPEYRPPIRRQTFNSNIFVKKGNDPYEFAIPAY